MVQFTGKTSDFLKIGVAAAARGDVERVREILKARPKWIRQLGSHGRTMLWEASHKGKLPMVKYLVRRKADIDACGTHYTPYFVEVSCYCIARHKQHHDVADYLLEKGATLDIHTAAFLGDCSGVKRYLKRDPKLVDAGHPQSVMAPTNHPLGNFYIAEAPWATPLCYALRGGDVETVELLLKNKARVKGNERALFIAADMDVAKVRLLLEHGADPEQLPEIDPDEGELLELVVPYGAKPADLSESDELVYLCRGDRGGNPHEVRRLLDLGCRVNFQDHKGKTALHRASKSGFLEAMQILLDHGANVDATDPKGETPLFDAVRSTIKAFDNQKRAIRMLLKAGADVRRENAKGQTARDVARGLKTDKANPLARLLSRKVAKGR